MSLFSKIPSDGRSYSFDTVRKNGLQANFSFPGFENVFLFVFLNLGVYGPMFLLLLLKLPLQQGLEDGINIILKH